METESKNLLGQYGLNIRKGQISRFGYDFLNRRMSSIFNDGTRSEFVYDAGGRLANITDTISGPISFTYDNLDRLVSEATSQGMLTYSYDAIGRRTSMSVNGGSPVTYQYDAASRLTQVAQGTQIVGLGYDQAGRRTTLAYPNGVTTNYSYDTASRLTDILHQSTTAIIESLTYTYDAAGNRISFTRSGPQADLPQPVQAAYDAANEQIQFNSSTPNLAYDPNGNLISQTDATGTTTYTWDSRNRLVGISGPAVSASFEYDTLGRRVNKTINGITTEYQYDGNDVAVEINGGIADTTYLRSLRIDEPFVRQGNTNEFYHTDALGSVLALTCQTGTAQTFYSYEPFGKTTVAGASSNNPFQFTGRENDGTGLYYYRSRYYSPTLQRFISEDPLNFTHLQLLNQQIPEGFAEVTQLLLHLQRHPELQNLYLYVANNPLTYNDPHGLIGWDTAVREIVKWIVKKVLKDVTIPEDEIMSEEEEQLLLLIEEMEELDPPPCITVGGRKARAC